jgi:hypothetical protein
MISAFGKKSCKKDKNIIRAFNFKLECLLAVARSKESCKKNQVQFNTQEVESESTLKEQEGGGAPRQGRRGLSIIRCDRPF